ncbi:MAG: GNAT family N-acetyltransferase [Deltaproteobacteria bacterium]|nr:GNAT family N-acetyltransferase [Deltaproteobacteria bacterium]
MVLEVRSATKHLVAEHASQLARWYNHPHNRALMGNSSDMTTEDVEEMYAEMRHGGGRPYVLFVDNVLAGDCDLRRLDAIRGEFAILVGDTARQGKGLGTRFTVMTLVHAFRDLALARVSLSVLPHNTAGRRCYQKAGYLEDRAPETLAFLASPEDVPMTAFPHTVRQLHPSAWDQVRRLP